MTPIKFSNFSVSCIHATWSDTINCFQREGSWLQFGGGLPTLLVASLALSLGSRLAVSLAGDVDGGGLSLLLVVLGVEPDGLTLVQGLEALGVDRGEVNEDVLAAVGGGDET